jgi:hypothetical protein
MLAEGCICLRKGCIQKTVGHIWLSEGRIRLSEGRIRLVEGRMWLPPRRIRLPEGRKRLPRSFAPTGERSCPPLCRARLLHMLEMLAWKSTSPLNMPCQPTVLMRGKMKNESRHVIPFLHEYVR